MEDGYFYFVVFGGLFAVVLISAFVYGHFEKLIKGYNFASTFKLVGGLDGVKYNSLIYVQFYDDKIVLFEKVVVPIESIAKIGFDTLGGVYEKQKSIIGRGIIGGLIFGPLGAILGGLSGIGTKQHEAVSRILTIEYIDTDNKEKRIILDLPYEYRVNKINSIVDSINSKYITNIEQTI